MIISSLWSMRDKIQNKSSTNVKKNEKQTKTLRKIRKKNKAMSVWKKHLTIKNVKIWQIEKKENGSKESNWSIVTLALSSHLWI